jgi:hypothetical protein
VLGVGLLIDRITALRTTRASARQGPPPREKIIASLGGRLVEAHERGWLGKVKGLQTSLAAEGAWSQVRAPDVSESGWQI